MKKLRFFFYTLISIGLPGLVFAQDRALATLGLEVYKAYYCGLCHQSTVVESKGVFGPPHDSVAVISQARILDPGYSGNAETVEAYLRESMLEPELYVVPGFELARHRMPVYNYMTEEELRALIYFLLNQKEVVIASSN